VKYYFKENTKTIVGAKGFTPPNAILLPNNLLNEDAEWLEAVDVEGEFGEVTKQVQVNQVLKNSIQAQRVAEQQAAIPKQVAVAAMGFGKKVLEDFIAENISMGITQDDMSEAVLDAMSRVEPALRTGTLYVAIKRLKEIPAESKDDKYITDARLLEAVNKLEEYLGVPLSETL
jgi:hypothetical protein